MKFEKNLIFDSTRIIQKVRPVLSKVPIENQNCMGFKYLKV